MGTQKGISQRYAFTVTLNPRMFRDNAEVQYDNVAEIANVKVSSIANKYTMVCELTKNCNIHFHGICDFQLGPVNLIKRFYDYFRCKCKNRYQCKCTLGFVNIKVIEDENGWIEYIKKDLKTTYDSICRSPIIHDGLNVFETGLFELYGIKG